MLNDTPSTLQILSICNWIKFWVYKNYQYWIHYVLGQYVILVPKANQLEFLCIQTAQGTKGHTSVISTTAMLQWLVFLLIGDNQFNYSYWIYSDEIN